MKRDPVHESCSGGRTGCDAVRVLRSRPALAGGVEPRMAGGIRRGAGRWFHVASESLAMDSCGARQSDVRDKRAGVSPRREQDCAKSWQEQ